MYACQPKRNASHAQLGRFERQIKAVLRLLGESEVDPNRDHEACFPNLLLFEPQLHVKLDQQAGYWTTAQPGLIYKPPHQAVG